jgi:hypothetical protein
MTVTRFYSNVAVPGTLSAALSNSATSMALASTPVGYPTSFPFTLAIDQGNAAFELVSVTSGAGTAGTPWQIVRNFDGTVASAHNAGAAVQHDFSAFDVSTSRSHENQGTGSGVHGLPSSAWNSPSFAVINETVLNNSTTATQTWNSIPGTYSHLLIVVQGRLTEATQLTDWVSLQLNGDSAAHYSYVNAIASNTSGSLLAVQDNTSFAAASIPLFKLAASQGGTSVNTGVGWAIIPNYANSVFNKNVLCQTGAGNGTTSMVDGDMVWGFWNPTSQVAVTSVSLSCPAACDFVTGTFLGLYGIS